MAAAVFERATVLEAGGEPGGAQDAIADLGPHTSAGGASADHAVGVVAVSPVSRLSGAIVRNNSAPFGSPGTAAVDVRVHRRLLRLRARGSSL
jgi:hypothetical protein